MPDSDEKTWLDVEREVEGAVTIRAEPNSISLHPLDDGVWELSAQDRDGEEVRIRVKEENGTLAELVAEANGV